MGRESNWRKLGVRKEVEREGLLRAIEIEGADLQPCGGTHVKSHGTDWDDSGAGLRQGRDRTGGWSLYAGRRAEQFATDDFERERDADGFAGVRAG